MKTLSILIALLALTTGSLSAQESTPKKEGQTVTFRFVPGEDMFYIPWGGNDAELKRLSSLIDEYRTEITPAYGIPIVKKTVRTKDFRQGRSVLYPSLNFLNNN